MAPIVPAGALPAPLPSCTAVVLADGLVPHLTSSSTDQLVALGAVALVLLWRWRLDRQRRRSTHQPTEELPMPEPRRDRDPNAPEPRR